MRRWGRTNYRRCGVSLRTWRVSERRRSVSGLLRRVPSPAGTSSTARKMARSAAPQPISEVLFLPFWVNPETPTITAPAPMRNMTNSRRLSRTTAATTARRAATAPIAPSGSDLPVFRSPSALLSSRPIRGPVISSPGWKLSAPDWEANSGDSVAPGTSGLGLPGFGSSVAFSPAAARRRPLTSLSTKR